MLNLSKTPLSGLLGKRTLIIAVVLYISLYVLICIVSGIFAGFQQTHNDFWDTYLVARKMSLCDPRTWFYPFYPVGYCLFLKLIMGTGTPHVPAIFCNIVFGAVTLFSSALLFRTVLGDRMAFAGCVLLSLYPRFCSYIQLGGPDPASVAFFSLGAFFIIGQCVKNPGNSWRTFFAGGFFLGCAAIFRYHVLVGGLLFLGSLALFYFRQWRYFLIAGLGLCLAYSPQWAINIITHHGLFDTNYGPINIYDLMYTINFYRISSLHLPSSAFQIIAADPLLFARKYAIAFWGFAPAYVPALLSALVVRDRKKRLLCFAVAFWVLCYCLLFSATPSGRALLLAAPLSILCVCLIFKTIAEGLQNKISRPRAFGVIAAGLVLLLGICLGKDISNTCQRRQQHLQNTSLETYMRGLGCTSAQQIFTSDFTVYFENMPPYIAYFNGGAPRCGGNFIYDEYPEFPVASLQEFSAECRERGVRFVLLTRRCGLLSPCLGELYNGTASNNNIVFKKEIARFRIYEINSPHVPLS
jgi:hypothetical protein